MESFCISLSTSLMSPGPCPPSNVSISTSCGVSTVSWYPDPGTDRHIATATTNDGRNYTCDSNNASSCSFPDLPCGENYSVTVVAVDRGCHSEPSTAVDLQTGENMFTKGTIILSLMLGNFFCGSQLHLIGFLIWNA